MEERSIAGPSGESYPPRRKRGRALSLEIGRSRFPILSLEPDGCTVEILPATYLRGYARVLEGDDIVALCLITLGAAEGQAQRVVFKSRIEARLFPPADYAS